ncbi:hypothetical protein F4823DRAFT_216032 [Ustulina deusta]|nr:hypothetical protein F4823DRAFT_216032 [Ustulina deusta]
MTGPPAPGSPSSPINAPTLQDQAETYFNMSLPGSNSMTLAQASIAGVPGINEQTLVAAAATHSSTPNSVLDTRPLDSESTDPVKAINGVAKKADVVPVSISAKDMQETKTSRPDATDAGRVVSSSNEPTPNLDVSSYQFDVAASAHEDDPPILQVSPVPASAPLPKHITQPLDELPEETQIVADTIVSNATNTQPSHPPSEHSHENNEHHSTSANHTAINIQALLDNITAQAANGDTSATHNSMSGCTSNGNVLPQSTLLPPTLPTPEQASIELHHPADKFPLDSSQTSRTPLPSNNGLALGGNTVAAPGTVDPDVSTTAIPAAIPVPNHAISATLPDSSNGVLPFDQPLKHQKQEWATFVEHEKTTIAEAKWTTFPDGSRIFIGNLSSERVTKRDIFDAFSNYGRLAQISLKQAYGFVQYHTVAEGQAAIDNLQGMELGGKKINLELSRTQKRDSEGNRSNRGKRDGGRHDGNRARRDDHRPGRPPSPRRSNHRQQPHYDSNNRGRNHQESSYSSDRRRTQSPRNNSRDPYRLRSVSPYRRHTSSSDLTLPRRHGTEVPDVQFLTGDVSHDFVAWVHHEFVRHGLRVDIRPLDPRSSLDEVIQPLAFEGVLAIVVLGFRAQERRKIPVQLFHQSDRLDNVPYDLYEDLNPTIAAQLVSSHRPLYRSQYSPAQHPPAYMPSSYANQLYSAAIAPGAIDPLHDPAVVRTLLATLDSAPRGFPTHHNMGYMHPPPNLASGAPHAGNPTQQVHDFFTQLTRPRQ